MESCVCPSSDPSLGRIVEAIETYLSRHPVAADSEAGIAAWWLAGEGVEADAADIRPALDWLVLHGRLLRQEVPGGQVVYRAAGPLAGG